MNKTKIEELLGEEITKISSLGGGCIGNSALISTKNTQYFVKTYPGNNNRVIECEANGLNELSQSKAVRIPQVRICNSGYLILEYIQTGTRCKNFMEIFGAALAGLHKTTAEKFGFYEDNFIGATVQKNTPGVEDWTEFYWENRLLYQLRLCEKNGYATNELKILFAKLDNNLTKILEGSENTASLIHGDLWGGNYLVDESGLPVLIDPAVYYGNREAELAMTMLFGGFDERFYHSYNETYPLPEGWKYRIDIYKLYHIINHLNLFGTGYYSQAVSLIKKYV